jgi:anaerobic magnesium-protoporphyrin IX monomethyl ester cyclase
LSRFKLKSYLHTIFVNEDPKLVYRRILFALCPTGAYCREDRCQSYFNFELIPSMRPPLEECEGAAGVRKAGGESLIIDAPAEKLSPDAFLQRIKRFNPDLMVLAVTFGTLEADLQWAARLKKLFPESTIALRGAPCYVWGEDILRRSEDVSFCVRGDYEAVFEDVVRSGFRVPGCIYKNNDNEIHLTAIPKVENLDTLPFQDRRTLNESLYTVRGSAHPQATIHVQRGCPFPCTFCLVHTVSGNRARHRSPESIVKEIQELQARGISHFYLRAETFTLDKLWVKSLCKALLTHCPNIRWVTATRVECVDDEVIRAMRVAGCYGISFGVDVASETIGKRVKKPPQLEAARKAMRLCDKHGIISLAYIMIGFIWDTAETLKEASEFIRLIRPDLLTVHFAHPYPGTPYYEAVMREGKEVVSLKAQATPALHLATLSTKDIQRKARWMLIRHYATPSVIFSLLKKITPRIFRSSEAIALRSPKEAL